MRTPQTASARLDLPQVTLCCVDTRSVSLALWAVQRCMAAANFGEVLFFGPDPETAGIAIPEGVQWVNIPPLRGIEDYNRFMLRDLAPHVKTSHVLVVQWDGFVTAPDRWSDEFLKWDYIGAPWYHAGHPGQVGNGGFSLRSHKLLQALLEVPVDFQHPEDVEICVHQQPLLTEGHGTRIAPLHVAQSFACEYGSYRPAFGFHGMHNFAHVFDEPTLAAWLESAPTDIIVHQHTRKLIKALMRNARAAEAIRLIRLRSRTLGWSRDQCVLLLRAHACLARDLLRSAR